MVSFSDIITLAAISDSINETKWGKDINFTNTESDYTFKKIMIMTSFIAVINTPAKV